MVQSSRLVPHGPAVRSDAEIRFQARPVKMSTGRRPGRSLGKHLKSLRFPGRPAGSPPDPANLALVRPEARESSNPTPLLDPVDNGLPNSAICSTATTDKTNITCTRPASRSIMAGPAVTRATSISFGTWPRSHLRRGASDDLPRKVGHPNGEFVAPRLGATLLLMLARPETPPGRPYRAHVNTPLITMFAVAAALWATVIYSAMNLLRLTGLIE
jgi:hypothetical protein